jgi:hypothetical protein
VVRIVAAAHKVEVHTVALVGQVLELEVVDIAQAVLDRLAGLASVVLLICNICKLLHLICSLHLHLQLLTEKKVFLSQHVVGLTKLLECGSIGCIGGGVDVVDVEDLDIVARLDIISVAPPP